MPHYTDAKKADEEMRMEKRKQAIANARIMAASPELLEACEQFEIAMAGGQFSLTEALDTCLLAIAKAKGMQND